MEFPVHLLRETPPETVYFLPRETFPAVQLFIASWYVTCAILDCVRFVSMASSVVADPTWLVFISGFVFSVS